ncbi:dual specificity mitogen-activated protein kinase kinase 5-like [Anneissia japonica]|uniref:dual specificity mitogen-activated protein kinase kinase 5-like n=1 Tax=Anneissia japonica TaxID=1529436 RepID=UPI001425BAB6|nr:dual specificity mitogen-activated protein kinase kinase 5-like [Anneissia japonica]
MEAMMSFYMNLMEECTSSGKMAPPLTLYPRVNNAGKRNFHGLTINTRPEESSLVQKVDSGVVLGTGHRHDAALREILANGTMAEGDIHYLEVLGCGHSGTVYKALHRPSNNIVAVKVMHLDISKEGVQKQIASELQILYKCDSPVIIGFYSAFFNEDRISFCTEFMDGGSLEMYKCIPEDILGKMTVSIVQGLNYLWSLKILHRDLKPSNILVNTQGEVKLCDFGVSAQLDRSIAETYIGTNAYMSPERVLGCEYGIPSEVWAIGIFLLEMATGRFPYPVTPRQQALSPIDLLQCIVHENPPSLSLDKFSEPFSDFISKCMQKDPDLRPPLIGLLQHTFLRMNDVATRHQEIATFIYMTLQQLKAQGLTKGL